MPWAVTLEVAVITRPYYVDLTTVPGPCIKMTAISILSLNPWRGALPQLQGTWGVWPIWFCPGGLFRRVQRLVAAMPRALGIGPGRH